MPKTFKSVFTLYTASKVPLIAGAFRGPGLHGEPVDLPPAARRHRLEGLPLLQPGAAAVAERLGHTLSFAGWVPISSIQPGSEWTCSTVAQNTGAARPREKSVI